MHVNAIPVHCEVDELMRNVYYPWGEVSLSRHHKEDGANMVYAILLA